MNRRLLRHLTIPVVPISVLLLAVGVSAAWWVRHLQERVSREMRENVSAMRAAEELEILIREFRRRLDNDRASENLQRAETLGVFRDEMEHWVAEVERWSFTPREYDLSDQVRQGWESLKEQMDRIVYEPETMTRQDYDRVESLIARILLKPTHEFLDLNEEEVDRSVTENQALADGLVFSLLVLGICGAGTGLAAGFWLARRFVARLEKSERAALRAEQLAALGHLAAGMAHELHNPLTTIKMLVQGALTEQDSGPGDALGTLRAPVLAGRDLTVLDEELTRLEALLRSFLDFARPPVPERRGVEVGCLVEQTLGLVAGRASAAGITVRFDRPPDPVRTALDPGQFRQVVLNLVLNALDAVTAGGHIDVRLEQGKGGAVTLSVADDGRGLPAELGARIFEPFITSRETGLGLGLSICKRIAEAHGGTIVGSNRPEGGRNSSCGSPRRARFPNDGTPARQPCRNCLWWTTSPTCFTPSRRTFGPTPWR